MAISTTYYIDTTIFSTATAVWTEPTLTTKAPDGYYSFGGDYREQVSGLLTDLISCTNIECTSYTVATTSSSSQSYTYTNCDGTPNGGTIGGTGGYDADTFCAQTDTVVLIGSELTLINNGIC